MEKYILGFLRYKKIILIFFILISILGVVSISISRIDEKIESVFGKDSPGIKQILNHAEKYGNNEIILLLFSVRKKRKNKSVYDNRIIEKITTMMEVLKEKNIKWGLTFYNPLVLKGKRPVFISSKLLKENRSEVVRFVKKNENSLFISKDKEKAILIISSGKDSTGEVIKYINKNSNTDGDAFNIEYISREMVYRELYNYIINAMFTLTPMVFFILLLLFAVFMRSFFLAVISLIPVLIGTLSAFSIIFISGMDLNIILILVPVFVLILGSADGLHFTLLFENYLDEYRDIERAMEKTIRQISTPVILTSLTSMAGFFSLIVNKIHSIRLLGLYTASGLFFAGLASLFLLPLIIVYAGSKGFLKLKKKKEGEIVLKVVGIIRSSRIYICSGAVVFTVFLIFNIFKIEEKSNPMIFFKETADIKKTYNRISDNFFSPFIMETEYLIKEGGEYETEVIEDVLSFERDLEKDKQVKKVYSIYDFLNSYLEIIEADNKVEIDRGLKYRFLSRMLERKFKLDYSPWIEGDSLRMFIFPEKDGIKAARHLDELLMRNDKKITGFSNFFYSISTSFIKDAVFSSCLTFLLVLILLIIFIRKTKGIVLILFPVCSTIIFTLGLLGFTGFSFNLMTVNIMAIVVGVAVDYSIHLYYYSGEMKGTNFQDGKTAAGVKSVFLNSGGIAVAVMPLLFSQLLLHSQTAVIIGSSMLYSGFFAVLVFLSFVEPE